MGQQGPPNVGIVLQHYMMSQPKRPRLEYLTLLATIIWGTEQNNKLFPLKS